MSKAELKNKIQIQDISTIKEQISKVKKIKKENIVDSYQLSIENFEINEQAKPPNTPLSIEACKLTGCDPSDLLYLPLEQFQKISSEEYLQKMHYNFHEAKRRGLIRNVRENKQRILHQKRYLTVPKKNFENSNSFVSTPYSKKDSFTSRNKSVALKQRLQPISSRSLSVKTSEFELFQKKKTQQKKYLKNLLKSEEQAILKQKELFLLQEADKTKEDYIRLKKEEDEKRKNDERKKNLQQKLKREEIERQQAEKKALDIQKRDQEEKIQLQTKMQEKIQNMKQKQKEQEKKTLQHQLQTEKKLMEQQKILLEKMYQKELLEKEKKFALERKKLEDLKRMQIRKQENDQKRNQTLSLMIQKENLKSEKFKKKQSTQDQKYVEYKKKKQELKEKIRQLGLEKSQKIQQIKSQVDQNLFEKKNQAQQKQQDMQNKVQQLKEQAKSEQILRNQLQKLKEAWKYENQERIQNIQRYNKEKLQQKLSQIDSKVNDFINEKKRILQERRKINTEAQLKRNRIKDMIYQMQVDKKWDPSLLQVFLFQKRGLKRFGR